MENDQLDRHMRRRLKTRKKLQEAAITLLLEKGYDALTIQDITDTADLGRGTFYIHFRDKEEIIWSVIEDGIIEVDRQGHQHIQNAGMPERPLFEGFRNTFAHADANRELYQAILSSHGSLIMLNRIYDLFAADFLKELERSVFKLDYAIPNDVMAQLITGSVIRSVIWWLKTDNHYSVDEMADMLDQAFRL